MKRIVVIFITSIICTGIYAQESGEQPTNEELLEKINQLEARLEESELESEDSNPMQTGDTVDWGLGFSAAARFQVPGNIGIDLMFSFASNKKKTQYTIGSTNKEFNSIIGIGIVADVNSFNIPSSTTSYGEVKAIGISVGPKFSLSSTVLLNFLSFSGYVGAYFSFAQDYGGNDFSNLYFDFEVGSEINFWMNRNFNMFIGFGWVPLKIVVQGTTPDSDPVQINIGFNLFFKSKD